MTQDLINVGEWLFEEAKGALAQGKEVWITARCTEGQWFQIVDIALTGQPARLKATVHANLGVLAFGVQDLAAIRVK